MKINSISNVISFKKTLMANASYIKDDVVCPAKIYALNPNEDRNYVSDLYENDKWIKNHYLSDFNDELTLKKYVEENDEETRLDLFVIEDENGECIGCVDLEFDVEERNTDITIFEVCPQYAYDTKKDNRNVKYVGEALLAFVSKFTRDVLKTDLVVDNPSYLAKDFYLKNGFIENSNSVFPQCLYIPNENIHFLDLKNKNRTGVGVEFVG